MITQTCIANTQSSTMDAANPQQMLLKRPINVKAIVTPRWKDEVQQQLQAQINAVDQQLQQLERQGQRAIAEIQKQSIQPPGPETRQQIESIQLQVNEKKSELLEQKNQSLQNLQQVQLLEMDQEVNQFQLEGIFSVQPGDNLIAKLQVEILLRDGIVEEIRGEI
jgi:NADH dehydrogenase/NADH:ubiquinone oxidoreductase subunit G